MAGAARDRARPAGAEAKAPRAASRPVGKGPGREGRREGVETEKAFIEVATRLFAEQGYKGTSIADIAREIGLTTASLYYHVSGKQELLLRVLAEGMAEFLDQLEDIAARPLDPRRKLRLAVENHLYFVLHNTDAVAVFLRERRFLDSPYKEQYQARVDRYDTLFTEIIREGMDQGSLPPGDAQLTRLAILGMINWIVEWYEPDGRLGSDAITRVFSDLITERLLSGTHS